METNVEQLVEKLLGKVTDQVNTMAKTETVIGDEFTIGEFSCRPVVKIGSGFASGGGTGEGNKKHHNGQGTGGAAGAGVGISPVGFLVTKGGEISFVPASNKKGLSAILEKAPDLIEKVMEMKEKKEGAKEKKEAKK